MNPPIFFLSDRNGWDETFFLWKQILTSHSEPRLTRFARRPPTNTIQSRQKTMFVQSLFPTRFQLLQTKVF